MSDSGESDNDEQLFLQRIKKQKLDTVPINVVPRDQSQSPGPSVQRGSDSENESINPGFYNFDEVSTAYEDARYKVTVTRTRFLRQKRFALQDMLFSVRLR